VRTSSPPALSFNAKLLEREQEAASRKNEREGENGDFPLNKEKAQLYRNKDYRLIDFNRAFQL